MLDELVTGADIGRRLGVSRQRVYQWVAKRPDFPQPAARLNRVIVWHWAEVETWNRRRMAERAEPAHRG